MDTFSNNKLCKICGIEKSLDEFYKNSNTKDGYLNECKKCYNQKQRVKYQSKAKKVDKTLLEQQQYAEEKSEIDQKLLVCNDPDELDKLMLEHNNIIQNYKQKLLERSSTSNFNILNENQDELMVKGKVQEFIMVKRKIILTPEEISIEKFNQIMKIQLPENIKLNQNERKDIIKFLKF